MSQTQRACSTQVAQTEGIHIRITRIQAFLPLSAVCTKRTIIRKICHCNTTSQMAHFEKWGSAENIGWGIPFQTPRHSKIMIHSLKWPNGTPLDHLMIAFRYFCDISIIMVKIWTEVVRSHAVWWFMIYEYTTDVVRSHAVWSFMIWFKWRCAVVVLSVCCFLLDILLMLWDHTPCESSWFMNIQPMSWDHTPCGCS